MFGSELMARRGAVYKTAFTCLVLFLTALVLEHGHFTRTQEFRGPFAPNPAAPSQYRVAVGTDIPFLGIAGPLPRGLRVPGEIARLQLWINGEAWDQPDGPGPLIEQGKLLGIRGLYRTLEFELPPHIANGWSTVLKVRYEIRPHGTLYSLIALAAGVFAFLAIRLAARSGDAWLRSLSLQSLPALRIMLELASWLFVIACLIYAGTIVTVSRAAMRCRPRRFLGSFPALTG